MNDSLKILVADDHSLVRDGLRFALTELPTQVEVAEASNAAEVRQAIIDQPAINLVILDLHMPGANDLELLKSICNSYPDIPVIVLSASEDQRTMQRAIEHGAAGFIPKSGANSVLLSALQLVLSGGVYIPSEILTGTSQQDAGTQQDTESSSSGQASRAAALEAFTGRQLDVLELMAAGHSNKVIARELGLSEHTVKIHLTAIFRTLGVHNRTEAAIACREMGLIDSR